MYVHIKNTQKCIQKETSVKRNFAKLKLSPNLRNKISKCSESNKGLVWAGMQPGIFPGSGGFLE